MTFLRVDKLVEMFVDLLAEPVGDLPLQETGHVVDVVTRPLGQALEGAEGQLARCGRLVVGSQLVAVGLPLQQGGQVVEVPPDMLDVVQGDTQLVGQRSERERERGGVELREGGAQDKRERQ